MRSGKGVASFIVSSLFHLFSNTYATAKLSLFVGIPFAGLVVSLRPVRYGAQGVEYSCAGLRGRTGYAACELRWQILRNV